MSNYLRFSKREIGVVKMLTSIDVDARHKVPHRCHSCLEQKGVHGLGFSTNWIQFDHLFEPRCGCVLLVGKNFEAHLVNDKNKVVATLPSILGLGTLEIANAFAYAPFERGFIIVSFYEQPNI